MAQVWTAVPDQVQQEPIDGPVSQRWVVVEFADELAAQGPHIIHVFLDYLF